MLKTLKFLKKLRKIRKKTNVTKPKDKNLKKKVLCY